MIFRCFANSIEKPDVGISEGRGATWLGGGSNNKEEESTKYLLSRSELNLTAAATHDDKEDVGG